MLRHRYSTLCQISLLRHSESFNVIRLYWNINQLCIDYSLRPHLSSRLTPGGRTFPGKPYPCGDTDFNRVYRYSCLDSHFQPVHRRLPLRLQSCWNALLPLIYFNKFVISAHCLVPFIFGANPLDRSAITHCLNDGCF